jgi:hypothetical protein
MELRVDRVAVVAARDRFVGSDRPAGRLLLVSTCESVRIQLLKRVKQITRVTASLVSQIGTRAHRDQR